MARTDPQLNFRCPPELKAKLEESARANARSLTAEIVQRLERGFDLTELETVQEKTLVELLDAIQRHTEALRESLPPGVQMDFKVSTGPRRNSSKKP